MRDDITGVNVFKYKKRMDDETGENVFRGR